MSGGFNPFPIRFGSSKHQTEEVIYKALCDADGTGLTKDPNSFNAAENFAIARGIMDVWTANRRLAYQWDPRRMQETPYGFLDRWEKILGLIPAFTDTPTDRRAAVAAKLALTGKAATLQVVHDMLVSILGSIFVGIYNGTQATAAASVPGGATIPGGATLPDGPFSSTLANVAIHVEKPAAMDMPTFLARVGQARNILDGLLPSWVDFSFYENSPAGVMGFRLDDPNGNLDREAFGV